MKDIIYIDVDGHILEPPDLWQQNLEQEYRDRAMYFDKDADGLETWIVDGKPHGFLAHGTSANMATFNKSQKWRKENIFEKHAISWEEGRAMNPGACDPDERIKLMDHEEIDKSILFPSLGLDWPAAVKDPGLMAAYCRVYNDWIVDFCSRQRERLFPTVLLPWPDIEGSVKEMRRNSGVGPRSIMCPGVPFDDVPYGDIQWDPIWREYQEEDIPVALHVSSGGTHASGIRYPKREPTPTWWSFSANTMDIQLSFMSFFQGNVFDRFPNLKLLVLESGCLWMPFILERMDEKYEILGFTTDMTLRPSEYFQRQCWIAMDPDDEFASFVIQYLGPDKVVWAYDYPHSDSPTDPVKNLKKTLKDLPQEAQRKVAGGNAIGLYDLL